MSEYSDASVSFWLVLACILFFVLGNGATRIFGVVKRWFQSGLSHETMSNADLSEHQPRLAPLDGPNPATVVESACPEVDTRAPEQRQHDEGSDEAQTRYRECVRRTTTSTECGRP